MTVRKKEAVIILILLVVALLPRVLDLGTFLTADEKNWIGRSYEFVRAFKDWRFNDMLQTTHPGVTALWLSGAAVTAKMLLAHVPFSFNNLIHFVRPAQMIIAIVNALFVPVIYLLLKELVKRDTFSASSLQPPISSFQSKGGTFSFLPLLGALFVALDPYLVGYSRVVHVDALLAGFMLTAALATLLYVQKDYSRRWLVASALLSGLAVLTKAPAVFLVPYFGLAVLARERRRLFSWPAVMERSRDFVLWLIIIGLMFVIVWPAVLWVDNPKGNALVLKRDLSIAAATPHHMSEDYIVNATFYIYTLLTRATPLTLALAATAVVLAAVAAFEKRRRRGSFSIEKAPPLSTWRGLTGLLAAYVFFFVLMMMLGAKKGDRYILPVFPAVNVLAAVGLVWVSGIIFNFQFLIFKRKYAGRYTLVVLSVLVVGYLSFTVYSYHPYAIAYSNPLLPDNLSEEIGWGEGLEQVGAWLSRNDPEAVAASWYPEELGAFTSARVAHINAHEQPRVHYVVLYRNMFGRAPDHYANNFIDRYYKKKEPVFTAYVHGKEFAWVYEKETYERVVGELLSPVRAGQELAGGGGPVNGVEIMTANYSGRARSGRLVVRLKRSLNGPALHQWRVPVEELKDNGWLRLRLPRPLEVSSVFVVILAEGTEEGDAPTIRYTDQYDYLPSRMMLSRDGSLSEDDFKSGDLALRLLREEEK